MSYSKKSSAALMIISLVLALGCFTGVATGAEQAPGDPSVEAAYIHANLEFFPGSQGFEACGWPTQARAVLWTLSAHDAVGGLHAWACGWVASYCGAFHIGERAGDGGGWFYNYGSSHEPEATLSNVALQGSMLAPAVTAELSDGRSLTVPMVQLWGASQCTQDGHTFTHNTGLMVVG